MKRISILTITLLIALSSVAGARMTPVIMGIHKQLRANYSADPACVGYWKMDGQSDLDGEVDYSAVGKNLIANGMTDSVSTVGGWVGNSRFFDGVNAYLSVNAEGSALDVSGASSNISIVARIKPTITTNNAYYGIASKYITASSNRQFELRITSYDNSKYKVEFGISGDGVTASTVKGDYYYGSGVSTSIAAVYNGVDVRLYADGTLIDMLAYTGGIYNGSAPVLIGSRDSITQFYKGLIDDVAIFNRALSANEIVEIARYGVTGQEPSYQELIDFNADEIYSLSLINSNIDSYLANNASWSEISVGTAGDGQNIRGIVIGPAIPDKTVMIVGGTHGNNPYGDKEGYSATFAIAALKYIQDHLASEYPTVRFVVIPCDNPSAWVLGQVKTNNTSASRSVNLNRNFPSGWGSCPNTTYGCSTTPTAWGYMGPSAASEPETQGLISTITTYSPDVVIDIHDGATYLYTTTGQSTTLRDTIATAQKAAGYYSVTESTTDPQGSLANYAYSVGALGYSYEVGIYASDYSANKALNGFLFALQYFCD